MNSRRFLAACAFPIALAVAGGADANVSYIVTLNTSSLGAGDFALGFQLIDGSGTNDNTVTLSDFGFGGGSAAGCALNCQLFGGASGDASSAVIITDSSFFNSFLERFTPGTSLSFKLDFTTVLDSPPDRFGFSIFDSGVEIPTEDPLGQTFLAFDIDYLVDPKDPNDLKILKYGSAPGSNYSLGAPTADPAQPPGQAPEPGSLLLMGLGLAALVGTNRRNQRSKR